MRSVTGLGLVALTAVPLAWLVGGCSPTDVSCEDLATCPHPMPDAENGADGARADSDAGPSADDADGAALETNVPADGSRDGSDVEASCNSMLPPNESPCLNEKIALFVSPNGNDQTANAGQKTLAFKTIGAAVAALKTGPKRIYLCDDGKGYGEQLTIDAAADPTMDGVSLYGGFDCATWTYATTRRAKINAPPIAVAPPGGTSPSSTALAVKGVVGGIKLADIELGVGNSILPGGSSIGVIVDTSMNVVFERVRIVVGFGADGAAGFPGVPGADGALPMQAQNGGAGVCSSLAPSQPGGSWLALSSCGSRGGSGGPANLGQAGYAGLPGSPAGADNSGAAGGGDGKAGALGSAGAPGAASTTLGSFSAAGYKLGPSGGDGSDGTVGQGGGGGGASHATGTCLGASGGAGGMGGCGGKKGLGGGSGGASIGVVSWSSSITLDHCELVVGNGGAGGNGGKGGLGGVGKDGGSGGAAFSSDAGDNVEKGGNGGRGGNGGVGGSGAGGNGGPSYGIVYKGDSASKNGTLPVHGNGGPKGLGGTQVGGVSGADGLVGPAANELQVN